jgi:hypothetical protein
MARTISLPFYDDSGTLTPAVISAMLAGATSALDPVDRTRIILTFATDAARDAFAAGISLAPQKRFWGVSSKTSLDAIDVKALSSETATGFTKTVTYDCAGGRYPYLAYPSTWGTPQAVTVGGLGFSDIISSDVVDTDGDGIYRVLRFARLQNGSAITVNWQ